MDKLKRKFINFMQGRYGQYGNDGLNSFLNIITFLFIISMFFVKDINTKNYINLVIMILIILQVSRTFSRNIAKRRAENNKFMNMTAPVRRFFTRTKRNAKDKNYKYIKCEKCNQELRVPKKKGKIMVKCKRCGHKFKVRT